MQPQKEHHQVFNEIAALVAMDFRTGMPLHSLEDVIDRSLSLSPSRYKGGFINRHNGGREEFYRLFHAGVEMYMKCYWAIEDLRVIQRDNPRYHEEYDARVIATMEHWDRAIRFLGGLSAYAGTLGKVENYPPVECAPSFPYDDDIVKFIIDNGVGVALGPDYEDGPLDADASPVRGVGDDPEDFVIWIYSDTDEVNDVIKGAFISLMECNL